MNFIFSCKKTVLRTSAILSLPLENKIQIFAPPCNILYILWVSTIKSVYDSVSTIKSGYDVGILHPRKQTETPKNAGLYLFGATSLFDNSLK